MACLPPAVPASTVTGRVTVVPVQFVAGEPAAPPGLRLAEADADADGLGELVDGVGPADVFDGEPVWAFGGKPVNGGVLNVLGGIVNGGT
jgi:hypothetical protein